MSHECRISINFAGANDWRLEELPGLSVTSQKTRLCSPPCLCVCVCDLYPPFPPYYTKKTKTTTTLTHQHTLMSRFIDADSWAKAPIKGLLEHAKTIVDAEVANGTIFQEVPQHIPPPPSDHSTNNSNNNNSKTNNNSTTTNVVQHNPIPKDERKNQPTPTLTKADRIPRFDREEIKMGRVVGRGGFCVVSEIREIRCLLPPPQPHRRRRGSHSNNNNNNNNNSADLNDSNQRTGRKLWRRQTPRSTSESTTNTTTNSETGDAGTRAQLARDVNTSGKFVVKQVNRDLLEGNQGMFLKGLIDIAMEAKFLANLDHTNIIPLRGECRQSPFDNNDINATDYFIILDYLPRTLPKQLNEWMHTQRATKGITGFCTSLGTGKDKKVQRLMTDRLFVAYDIAAAGNYLHEKNIIYRDFKPDNVGFTSTGVTKIIDFGLAREVTNLEKDDHGLYNLTGCTGGIRYMAPEVGLHRPYNTNADVYSWSMIFWYVLSLEPPLCLYTTDMIVDRVFEKGHRPATKNAWNPALTDLLRKCWTETIHERPTFREIMTELLVIVHFYDPQAQRDRWTLK